MRPINRDHEEKGEGEDRPASSVTKRTSVTPSHSTSIPRETRAKIRGGGGLVASRECVASQGAHAGLVTIIERALGGKISSRNPYLHLIKIEKKGG